MRVWTTILGFVVFLGGIWGCSQRERLNPLDPNNPETGGRPTGLWVVSEKHEVTLSWDPLSLEGVLGYNVYRRQEGEEAFRIVDFASAESSSFQDPDLPYDQRVAYRISAVASEYESPLSDSVSITPGPNNYWMVDYYSGVIARLTYDGLHTFFQTQQTLLPVAVAADSTTGTAWIVDAIGYLVRISDDGQPLLWIDGLTDPAHVALDPLGGVVWVSDDSRTCIARYDTMGNLLGLTEGFGEISDISWVEQSGGCWVADVEGKDVVFVSSSGDREVEVEEVFEYPRAISYYPSGEWLWVADSLRLARVWNDGTTEEVVTLNQLVLSVSADQTTGDCWVIIATGDEDENAVLKISANGEVLTRVEGFYFAQSLVANGFNGGCLVADTGNGRIVRVSQDGDVLGSLGDFYGPWDVAIE